MQTAQFSHGHLGAALLVRHFQPYVKGERAALSRHRSDRDSSLHHFNKSFGNGQAQPGAAIVARGGRVGLGEGLKQSPTLFGRHADTRVFHVDTQLHLVAFTLRYRHLDLDLALVGEFDCVLHQIGQHLAQANPIAHQPVGHPGLHMDQEFQTFFLRLLCHQRGGAIQHIVQPEWHALQAHLAGLNLGEIQNIVDDRQQGIARRIDLLHIVQLTRRQLGAQRQVRQANDGVHRRADLMAHVGKKLAFRAGGLLGAVACLLQFTGLVQQRLFLRLQLGLRLLQFSCLVLRLLQ